MKKILILLTLFIFGFTATAQAADLVKTKARQVILLDYDTGTVLFEKNADQKMPTSSMSKVMTIYLIFEALKEGQIDLEDKMHVSEKAWRKGGSKMFVEVNSRVRVEDLIKGVLVQSGNDATIVLAEGLAGTEDAFAKALNIKAQELGMTNSHFMNASGWPDPDHYSTARDLSTLAKSVIVNFPDYFKKYFSIREYTYNNITQKNRNPLLYRDIGADGMKTGHTEVGGYGVIGTAMKNGRRVILVANGMATEKERAQESAKLLEWGLRGFKNETIFNQGDVLGTANVVMGENKQVPLALGEDVRVTLPSLSKKEIKADIVYNGPLVAPIAKGQEVATLKISMPGLAEKTYPLQAAEDVDKAGFFSRLMTKAQIMINGKIEEHL